MVSVLLTAFAAHGQERPDCRTRNTRLENFIAAKAQELDGHEYCQFRHYQTLFDLDGDRKEDFICMFTIEYGASGYSQFLVAFLSSGLAQKPPCVMVGKAGVRNATGVIHAGGGTITLPSLKWRDTDAGCCPSDTVTQDIELQNGNLVNSDPIEDN